MSPSNQIVIERLGNGLTVIIEEIPDVQSVAYELSLPGGIVTDASEHQGSCLILAELTSRGAGPYDSVMLSNAFDDRGIRHSESAGQDRFFYRGLLLSEQLDEAMRLVSLMIREPRLPVAEIENIRGVLLQDIAALIDNPARRVSVELMRCYYPEPFNRPGHGSEVGLKSCNAEQQLADWQRRFGPSGSILSIAGRCQAGQVLEQVNKTFGSWSGQSDQIPAFGKISPPGYQHITYDAAQLQIALAYPSAPFGSRHYFTAKVATQVLSGGMFGRLFTEVREKRGLCYSVYARHSATKDFGTIMAYAGTTPERAQETLDVLIQELKRIPGTVTIEELRRAKANLKAALVIGEESSSARASSNAQDWWLDKRIRTIELAE